MQSINEYLPPELLAQIFSHYIETEGPLKFLRNIPTVCKLWRNLSSDSSLWKEVSWESISRNFEHLLRLGEMGLLAHTRTLDLSTYEAKNHPHTLDLSNNEEDEENYPNMSAENLLQVIQYCHNVRKLDVSNNDVITEEVSRCLAEKFPKMEKLVFVWNCGNFYKNDDSVIDCPRIVTLNIIDPILKSFGRTLTHLSLTCHITPQDGFVSEIADCCPALEKFHFWNIHDHHHQHEDILVPFPIYKLETGCPKLRTLEICMCRLEFNEELKKGFRELKIFHAVFIDFQGLDVNNILRNSTELEKLKVSSCRNTTMNDIFMIPSNKVKVLAILMNGDVALKPIEKAVKK